MITKRYKLYKNFGKCMEISNGTVKALVTVDIGPRVIYYGVKGMNIMHEHVDRLTNKGGEFFDKNFKESEKWYQALEAYVNTQPKNAPETVQARRELYYLRVALPHRGSRGVAALLVDGARLMMRGELNARSMSVAGSSPSLLNGGKDFCCWLGHAEALYRSIRRPVEMALGKSGVGLGNIALGEALLETDLEAHYDRAMELVTAAKSTSVIQSAAKIVFSGFLALSR